ncbi:hypothetical protein ES703_44511 [subsurface metagenome]
MNKKILIGSIIAVAILVLVSFTGVVGYQTTKSSTIARASPLFSVRTSRALDKESKDLSCDYVGKGEVSIISIPKSNNENIQVQKMIEAIRRMNKNSFDRFINSVINHLKKKTTISDKSIGEIVNLLRQLKTESVSRNYNDISEIIVFYKSNLFLCTLRTYWEIGCYLNVVIILITIILNFIRSIGTPTFIPCGECGPKPNTLKI